MTMNPQPSVFDDARTKTSIDHFIREISRRCIQSAAGVSLDPAHETDFLLNTVTNLTISEMLSRENSAGGLLELCRLLIKLGDAKSLEYSLALTHRVFELVRAAGQPDKAACVYKGISQIGLGRTDIGIKNVLFSLAEPSTALSPLDFTLGNWALMSAAIVKKNIRLAMNFARKWQESAASGGLDIEQFRASIVIHIFHLLLAETDAAIRDAERIFTDPPEEWREVADFLDTWTRDIRNNRCSEIRAFAEPLPLFLGVDWDLSFQRPAAEAASEHFHRLCEFRRRFCTSDAMTNIVSAVEPELLQFGTLMAKWEIAKPLREFESILRVASPMQFLKFTMSRMMGKSVVEKVICESSLTPEVTGRDDAIILVMDVRKFSTLCEQCSPDRVFDILNPIFRIMDEELEKIGGTILEFVGDCIIIVFNTFEGKTTRIQDILSHTVQCLKRIHVLSALSRETGIIEIRVGVGINRGPVALGYLGGLARCHLTVLGNTINIAARLETASKSLPGDIIVSKGCFADQPQVWETPFEVNYSLRDMNLYSGMKNISLPVHVFALRPLIRTWVDFVPMGFTAGSEKGVVYIDTGNSDAAGVLDHHHPGQPFRSACELLIKHPERLFDHIRGLSLSEIEFRLHAEPDLDCAATLYAAYELMNDAPRIALLEKLSEYVSKIDQGTIPAPSCLDDSLYGVYLAHVSLLLRKSGAEASDLLMIEAELRVVDAAMFLMEAFPDNSDFASVFRRRPTWFAEERRMIRDDYRLYEADLRTRSHTYRARINGETEPVVGLWADHPESLLFKFWARNDGNAPSGNGYRFLTVDWSGIRGNRFVISVAPESHTDLQELGQCLEQQESAKRKRLGKERPVHPIRYPADNSDPWYFGQGHGYTIIDSPYRGSVLSAQEVQKIHEEWAGAYPQDKPHT